MYVLSQNSILGRGVSTSDDKPQKIAGVMLTVAHLNRTCIGLWMSWKRARRSTDRKGLGPRAAHASDTRSHRYKTRRLGWHFFAKMFPNGPGSPELRNDPKMFSIFLKGWLHTYSRRPWDCSSGGTCIVFPSRVWVKY